MSPPLYAVSTSWYEYATSMSIEDEFFLFCAVQPAFRDCLYRDAAALRASVFDAVTAAALPVFKHRSELTDDHSALLASAMTLRPLCRILCLPAAAPAPRHAMPRHDIRRAAYAAPLIFDAILFIFAIDTRQTRRRRFSSRAA